MSTLLQLRTRAQEESDNVNSDFISTSEWLSLINSSYQELYGLLVTSYGENYAVATPYTFVTDGQSQDFALPDDFFKLLGVDLQVQASGIWTTMKPFIFNERNRFTRVNSPVPMAGQTVRLWYVPVLTLLADDGDSTVNTVNGWEEYIVVDAAMKALAKEESDVSVVAARKAALVARINGEASNRDAGSPAHIGDYYAAASQGMRYAIVGGNLRLIGGNAPVLPYGDGVGFDGWGWT